jgi:cyclase
MITKRIIPRLDIKGPNLVKGIHLEGLRVLGKPSDFASYYYENGADELIFMDVVASLYGRNNLHNIITETAQQVFIPITVGGGIRTIEDIRSILRAGADKVSLNTAVIKNPNFIKESSRMFGSSTIIVSIEAIREKNGKYLAYTDNGREYTGLDVFEWAQKAQELGAGEILLTSVDTEGTGHGFCTDLIEKMEKLLSIPIIVHGGAGKKEDITDLFKNYIVEGVAISSILHYDFIRNNNFNQSNEEGNYEFLKQNRNFHSFESCTIDNIKESLLNNGIKVRY